MRAELNNIGIMLNWDNMSKLISCAFSFNSSIPQRSRDTQTCKAALEVGLVVVGPCDSKGALNIWRGRSNWLIFGLKEAMFFNYSLQRAKIIFFLLA